jgi:hypothetical protein
VNLDEVSLLLTEAGLPAEVVSSPEGVPRICAGVAHRDAGGVTHYQVVVGPGWYEGRGLRIARGRLETLTVGPDDDAPSNERVGVGDASDELDLTRRILDWVAQNPRA